MVFLTSIVFAYDAQSTKERLDEATKASLYEQSAENYFRKGFLSIEGINTPQNIKKGLRLYLKSACIGYRMAQEALAEMYCNGDKVDKDLKKCAYWANRADYKELWKEYKLWNYISYDKYKDDYCKNQDQAFQ